MGEEYSTPYMGAAKVRRHQSNHEAQDTEAFLSALSGGFGLAGTYMGMANQSLGLQDAPGMQRSATGEPIYNLGSTFNQAFLADPQGASGGEILAGAGQGASAGAAFGPWGAAIGGVVGGVTTAIGGSRRRKKQREEKDKALTKLSAGQRTFNNASRGYEQTKTALDGYRQRLNTNNQMYNLYRP